jgi:AraC family transcriptional regulator of adaptative response / DNA-3-methyladenine glycosylase II
MSLEPESCYRAMKARDRRFDGLFYVGVTTTGVYCRPICPARLPRQERCEFFRRAAEAERAGFRACFRCRPELAPGSAPVDSVSRLAHAAIARIDAGFLNERGIDDLAGELAVSSRHLRRVMESELGVTPVELAQTKRLALAKQLLQDSSLPVAEIAFASGFQSLRRFNALFRERFGRPPSDVRRRAEPQGSSGEIALRLDYRPPYDVDGTLEFLRGRAVPGVERVEEGVYLRSVAIGEHVGAVRVSQAGDSLAAHVSLSLTPVLMDVVARLRRLFDLDAHPDRIALHLKKDPRLAPLLRARRGLRVPGAFEPFELAVRAVLGQLVSVRAATTLSGRLVERFGRPIEIGRDGVSRLFPSAARLASASISEVRAIGLPEARARAIVGLAQAIESRRIELTPGFEPEATIAALTELDGIGPWTAQYIAMRALRWPDAFPASDLAVMKALGVDKPRAAIEAAERWRPWRAYAVMALWSGLSGG